MKKGILLLLISGLQLLSLNAQTFTQLGTDPQNDPKSPGIKDLGSLSYAIDKAQDSIWFELVFFTATKSDFGAMIGVDTDLVAKNGTANWFGSNTSLTPDYVIFLERNGFFETNIRATTPFGNNTALVKEDSANKKVRVGMKLSLFDGNGKFNVMAGSGSFDLSSSSQVYDEIPDATYFTVGLNSGIGSLSSPSSSIDIYPNPASDKLTIRTRNDLSEIHIYNALGRLVETRTPVAGEAQVNTETYPRGIYFVEVKEGTQVWVEKVMLR